MKVNALRKELKGLSTAELVEKENELKEYYRDWELVKYNEDFGQLHKTDANGNRFKLRFATMLAKKIK